MAKDLLFEIGTEEIPAGFVPKTLKWIEGFLRRSFEARKLGFESIDTLGTPRRLAFIVRGLSERQPDSTIEVKGPQIKAAFDEDGNPTGALKGFLKSQGASLDDVKRVASGKGEYAAIVKEIRGGETASILPEVLKDALSGDIFPKSMRWGDYDTSFARPVHWLLALYGETPVEFEWGHIRSASSTFGHRFLSQRSSADSVRPAPVRVASANAYEETLKGVSVIASPEKRKRLIAEGLAREAKAAGGSIVPDEGLLDEVAYLVEYPVVIRGGFSPDFLSMPKEIIINAMREHQRYFSLTDDKGALLPFFLTVANTAQDPDTVRKGNERVLRARLNDAKFYYELDIKKPLSERVEALKGVVFQAKLGTSYEKVERFASLALHIGEILGYSQGASGERPSDYLSDGLNPALRDRSKTASGEHERLVIGRSAMLAKADLTSGVVGEFPKLQGVMGSFYASFFKEAPEVSAAIYEHYLPTASGGQLPASVAGAVVSMADKLDTIAGCFGVGLIPTGAQDPYALRRQSLGIIAIIIEKDFRLDIGGLVDKSVELLRSRLTRPEAEVKADVLEFLKERLKNQLLSQGFSFDSVDAVLSARWHDMADAANRIKALESFKRHPSCAALVTAFKRVSNILKGVDAAGPVDAALFREPEEKALFEAETTAAPVIEGLFASGDYEKAFESLAALKDRIDEFFNKVMVMAEDRALRENRLALLASFRDLYIRAADLSRLISQ